MPWQAWLGVDLRRETLCGTLNNSIKKIKRNKKGELYMLKKRIYFSINICNSGTRIWAHEAKPIPNFTRASKSRLEPNLNKSNLNCIFMQSCGLRHVC